MSPQDRPPRAEYRLETPRPDRVTSIGEALEGVLGAFAARQRARQPIRPGYSPALAGAGSMSACGSVSTR